MAGRRPERIRPTTFVQTPDVKDPVAQRAFDTLTRAIHDLQTRKPADLVSQTGAVTTPAVPATTVAVTNTTGHNVTVYLKGGTLTVITLAGVVTGIAAAAAANTCHVLPLSRGQTIAITYTVAPTWVWVAA